MMYSIVYLQPGETVGCVGCHDDRRQAPVSALSLAPPPVVALDPPPWGTAPFDYQRVVQPVLDAKCVRCHNPQSEYKRGIDFDLTPEHAWDTLCNYGKPSLAENVRGAYALGYSVEGTGAAITSPLLALLTAPEGHYKAVLSPEEVERVTVWLDTYGQRLGAFSDDQEHRLEELKAQSAELLAAR